MKLLSLEAFISPKCSKYLSAAEAQPLKDIYCILAEKRLLMRAI